MLAAFSKMDAWIDRLLDMGLTAEAECFREYLPQLDATQEAAGRLGEEYRRIVYRGSRPYPGYEYYSGAGCGEYDGNGFSTGSYNLGCGFAHGYGDAVGGGCGDGAMGVDLYGDVEGGGHGDGI